MVLRLVAELEPLDAGRRHDGRRALEREADEADVDAAEPPDREGREDRPARRRADDVGGEEAEVRAGEAVLAPVAVAVDAAVGMTAAPLHPPQLAEAVVELVVADRAQGQPDPVPRLDRRLVVEQRRDERAGADEVARRDAQRVPRG